MLESVCLGFIFDIGCCPENLQWSAGDAFRAVHNYDQIVPVFLKTKLARQVKYLSWDKKSQKVCSHGHHQAGG